MSLKIDKNSPPPAIFVPDAKVLFLYPREWMTANAYLAYKDDPRGLGFLQVVVIKSLYPEGHSELSQSLWEPLFLFQIVKKMLQFRGKYDTSFEVTEHEELKLLSVIARETDVPVNASYELGVISTATGVLERGRAAARKIAEIMSS